MEGTEEKKTQEVVEESDKDSDNSEELEKFRKRISELEMKIEEIRKESDQKCLEFVEKKSKEASQVILKHKQEFEEKLKGEFEEKLKYRYENSFIDLVNIVSQFESVVESIKDPAVSNYLAGFNMFLSKFVDLFSSLGISEINPQVNDEFNSEVMEASKVNDVSEANMDNKIVNILSKGYKLHDRVIKLASVEVGKFNS